MNQSRCEKGKTLPNAEIGLALECMVALCTCRFGENEHSLLKAALHGTLQQELVAYPDLPLSNWVTPTGDTLLHLLGRKAPVRHLWVWERMHMFLQKYDEQDQVQYACLSNKAGFLALEVAVESFIDQDIDERCKDSGWYVLAWLFSQTGPEEIEPGAETFCNRLEKQCVDALCRRARSPSLTAREISTGITFFLDWLNKYKPEFCQSCLAKAAKTLQVEKNTQACQNLLKGVQSFENRKFLTETEKHLREPEESAQKEKADKVPQENPAQQIDVGSPDSPCVLGKRQSVLKSYTYLRQALDARLGETADDSHQMPGMKALVQGLMILLELLSSADFVTDILLVRWMYLSHHVWWATLSCLMMVAPYLAAFSATLRISLRNRIFEATDSCGNPQSFYRCRQLAAAVCMTPLCVAAFIFLDLVYSIKAATFDILALFIGLVKPGMTLDVTGGVVSKFLSDHLGLTTMDIEGYRRLRTTTQLLFESFPQIVLQLHILLQSSGREFNVSDEELVVSLAFALFHLLATCYIVWLEAKSAGESFTRYTMTCLTGRLSWLPLADALTDQNKDADSRKMHFDDLSVVSGCGRFAMAFEFSQSTWAKLLGLLSKVQDKADGIHMAFGPSIALMSIDDISNFHKRFPKVQVSMRSGKEPVPWTRILQNSGFSLDKSGKVTIGAEQQATAQRLLEDFISNHNHEAVHALLEADVCVTGLTSGGLLYLTFAVEMKLGCWL